MMGKNSITIVQIMLYLLSPFISYSLALKTNTIDLMFLAMFIIISISQWLAIKQLDQLRKK